MKRLVISLALIICLSLAGIYIFIPANLVISKVVIANCNPDAADRIVIKENNPKKWLASDTSPQNAGFAYNSNSFIYKNDTFQITKKLHNSLDILISNKNYKISSSLNILPVATDSLALQWQCNSASGTNPFQKIQRYREAVRVKENMTDILTMLRAFLERKENVYGIDIQKTSTADTFLVATKAVFVNYPSTNDIYNLIRKLQEHLAKKGAQQTNAPMVNVSKSDSAYHIMVAIPVNVKLTDDGSIFFRRMVPGSFLVSEVKGGNYTVDQAFENMHLYITDYRKTSMAIPFQSLVTDRSKEPDTSKWITRLYYPVAF